MALLFWDSFDHYADGDKTEKWSSYNPGTYGGYVTVGAYGRNGTSGLRAYNNISATAYLRRALSGSPDTVTVGLAFRLVDDSVANTQIVRLLDNTTAQVYLRVINDLSIQAYGGGALRGSSDPGTITHNVYHYIEVQTVIGNAPNGSIEVRVDDVTVINLPNIDTQASGNSQVTQIEIGGIVGSGMQDARFDDLYVCDDAGAYCNDFLGDTRIIALLPDGVGNHADWTPSAGANWQCVDENPPDGDTTYNSTVTATDRDSFTMDDLPVGIAGTIHAVCGLINCRKDDAGTRTLQPSVRVAATDYDGPSVNLPSTYAYHNMYPWEVNPNTAAPWLVAAVNAVESGYELVA